MRNYAERDLLVFSACFGDLGSHKTVRDKGDTRITHGVQVINFISPSHVARRLFYLDSEDARRILEAKSDEQVVVRVLYWTPERTKNKATSYLQAKYLAYDDLVVTRQQCDAFEERHGANGVAGLAKKVTFLLRHPTQRKELRLVGGALVAGIAAIWAVFKWYVA